MSEINVLKGQWKSWILPKPRIDAVRLMDMAVLRPLAMLLKNRGIHLIPAAAVAHDSFAALVISPFGLERNYRYSLPPAIGSSASAGPRFAKMTGVWPCSACPASCSKAREQHRAARMDRPDLVQSPVRPALRDLQCRADH